MAKDQTQQDATATTQRIEALLDPDGMAATGLEQILTLQREVSQQTETFARHWLERRQEALETGVDALREISGAEGADPAKAMRALTNWQRGSIHRLTEDLQEWMTLCTQTAAAYGEPPRGRGASSKIGEPERGA